jgi:predicted thioesterase
VKPIAPGTAGRYEITPDAAHTAAAIGNHGVEVVGTPFLIGWLEVASHNAILPSCEPGEATVGTRVEVDHLGPAFPGRPVVAEARVVAVDGRKVQFEVSASQDGRVVMSGRHGRAIVNLDRFLKKLAPPSSPSSAPGV